MYEQGLITLFHNLLSKVSSSQPLISPSRQPGKYARRHSCPGKFHLPVRIPSDALWDGFNVAVATEQHVNAGEGQVYLFIFFSPDSHANSFPVHRVRSCSCRRTQINQNKWKLRPLRLPWRLKGRLSSLFLFVFGLLFWSANITKRHILIKTTKTADVINWSERSECRKLMSKFMNFCFF